MNTSRGGIPKPELPGGFYARIRLLSLDVVAGALGSAWMVSELTGARMSWAWYVVLGAAVWLIYTLDHLLDARRLGAGAHTPRHLFHHRHFRKIMIVWLLLAVAGVGLALSLLDWSGIVFGLGMGALVIVHLLLVRVVGERISPLLVKEAGVALIYSAGIWGLPVIVSDTWTDLEFMLMFAQFFLLALVNLLEFSLYERHIDERDGHTSFVRAIGVRSTRALAVFLLLVVAGIFVFMQFGFVMSVQGGLPPELPAAQVVFFLIGAVLASLLFFDGYFSEKERYRAWGDGAFLLPFLFPLFTYLYSFLVV